MRPCKDFEWYGKTPTQRNRRIVKRGSFQYHSSFLNLQQRIHRLQEIASPIRVRGIACNRADSQVRYAVLKGRCRAYRDNKLVPKRPPFANWRNAERFGASHVSRPKAPAINVDDSVANSKRLAYGGPPP
jgi:hypothetical protein